ncbi:MAG: molybdopterin cofactor-binding domain-containing protein [Clostridium sp.]
MRSIRAATWVMAKIRSVRRCHGDAGLFHFSGVDVASITLKLNDDGFYTMMIGASDMGTGCDTTLAQMAADCMDCDP